MQPAVLVTLCLIALVLAPLTVVGLAFARDATELVKRARESETVESAVMADSKAMHR